MDRGAYHLTPDGSEPILLFQGDIALLPSGIGHAVSDAGERPVRPFGEIFGGTLEGMSPAGLIVEGGRARSRPCCARWRMTAAARLVREGRVPLRRTAHEVGYDSEFAFARAFKRVVGRAPAATVPNIGRRADAVECQVA